MPVSRDNWSVRRERAERVRERAVGVGEVQFLALAAMTASLSALAHYYKWGQILLSGDAVAHINIARRVFDSRTPGLQQLGTVWLPLQHLLTIPFIISDAAWSSGVGGAIPSMAAYLFGVLGMFRLVRSGLAWIGAQDGSARIAAWIAAAVFAANPNLIYLQTTALNEPLSLALIIWATAFFTDFTHFALQGENEEAARHLKWSGWLLLCAMLVRYDAWFYGAAFIVAAAAVVIVASRRRMRRNVLGNLGPALATFILVNAIAPAIWAGYNAYIWGSPLEFATGQYSAKAIEQRSRRPGDPHHPGWHSPSVAGLHFVRNATLTMSETKRESHANSSLMEKTWLFAGVAAILVIIAAARGLMPWLLLWLPVPFYSMSIAWGDIPIFIPQWWPFSYYNTRYGLQMLPAFAFSAAVLVYYAARRDRSPVWRIAVPVVVLFFLVFSYAYVWKNVPMTLREIRANGGARYAIDGRLGAVLEKLPPTDTLLMYLGDHGGALERAAIPLKRTINEGTFRTWDIALQAPASNAEFVIAGASDPVAQAVQQHPENLELLMVVQASGSSQVRIYRSTR